MGKTIGIDLGTTYSVIAVKGNVELTTVYPAGTYLDSRDVTIIPAPDGNLTFPSILWKDPDNPDMYIMGYNPGGNTEQGISRIMFSKRRIGTTESLALDGHVFSAREVATHFLKHIKTCAEQALGEPVTRAIITHPAYFNENQIAETKQAAIDAGFSMSDEKQMLMEPEAASLAHTLNTPDEDMTVMVYDLGGGTFDVTIMTKDANGIDLKAFDGNPLLGGFNFDRELADWFIHKISVDQGRSVIMLTNDTASPTEGEEENTSDQTNIPVDLTSLPEFQNETQAKIYHVELQNGRPVVTRTNNPVVYDESFNKLEENKIEVKQPPVVISDTDYDQLMELAENLKMDLSRARTSKMNCPINIKFLQDINGHTVQFIGRLNREQYSHLIDGPLENTTACCHQALQKAGLQATELSVILFVGGSCYGPWVREKVEAQFGGVTILPSDNPDLDVACGAAIVADQLGETVIEELVLVMNMPKRTPLPFITVTGSVTLAPDVTREIDLTSLLVVLETPHNGLLETHPLADGTFSFTNSDGSPQDVDLEDMADTQLSVMVTDTNGIRMVGGEYTVEYDPGGGDVRVTSKLPKTIHVETADGISVLATEGVELPYRPEDPIRHKRLFGGSVLTIPVFQDNTRIGDIIVDDIPENAGAGCVVEIEVEFTRSNYIRGEARVLTESGDLAKNSAIRIQFPPLQIPPTSELEALFQQAEADYDQALIELAGPNADPAIRMEMELKGNKLVEDIRQEFKKPKPDRQILFDLLTKLKTLLKSATAEGLDPPRHAFDSMVNELQAILDARNSQDPQVQSQKQRLLLIAQKGRDAYPRNDQKTLGVAMQGLEQLRRELIDPPPPPPPPELPSTPEIIAAFENEIDDLRRRLKEVEEGILPDEPNRGMWREECGKVDKDIAKMEKPFSDKVNPDIDNNTALAACRAALSAKDRILKKIDQIRRRVETERG